MTRSEPEPEPEPDEGEDDDDETEEADDDGYDEAQYLELLPFQTAIRLRRIPDDQRRREAIQAAVLAVLRSHKMKVDGTLSSPEKDDDALKLLPNRIAAQIKVIPEGPRREAAIENAIKSILRGHKARIEREAEHA